MKSKDIDKWIDMMHEEQSSVELQGIQEVHDITDVLKERRAIGSYWVYTIKLLEDGSIERYKARLVVKSCLQIAGIDFSETFALVTQYNSLCLLTALAALHDLDTIQLDIKSTFTHDLLDKEIQIAPPLGLGLDNKVLLLKKALYDLKYAFLQWYRKQCSVPVEQYFISTHFDPCTFISTKSNIPMAVYINDIALVSKTSELKNIIKFL